MIISKITIIELVELYRLANDFDHKFIKSLLRFEYLVEQGNLTPEEILKNYSKNPEYLNIQYQSSKKLNS
ncbi:MAG: hypothetical protein EKK61_00300 [Rickettsiales bacterium]|nr:MAG: hypothetical protein EKK61_00300 [Rickettsiales bacterium]